MLVSAGNRSRAIRSTRNSQCMFYVSKIIYYGDRSSPFFQWMLLLNVATVFRNLLSGFFKVDAIIVSDFNTHLREMFATELEGINKNSMESKRLGDSY